MNEIIFNRKDYESYKDFYHDISVKLKQERFIDWRERYKDLNYNADFLNEFLWYCNKDNNLYVFLNFDREKIKLQKNYDDYEYNIIFTVFERFVKQYPNNKIEFRMVENSNK